MDRAAAGWPVNDHIWFGWIIDIVSGSGRGANTLVPPGYDGPLPEGGFFIAQSKTNRALYAARSFLIDNDPKPTVELIKKYLRIYPYSPGGVGTSIATALEGKVRLAANPPIPETKFVEGTGKAFNTIPPSDYGFFEMINENDAAGTGDQLHELAGQLAALIAKGFHSSPMRG
jgi:hypothetical protein